MVPHSSPPPPASHDSVPQQPPSPAHHHHHPHHHHRHQQVQTLHAESGVPFGHVPAYLPGSASLIEELDENIMLVLRDGKHIVGTLISFDQFSNLVLQDAVERRFCVHASEPTYYVDEPLGLYVVRGDSLVLSGAVHDMMPGANMLEVNMDEYQQRLAAVDAAAPRSPTEWDFDGDLQA